MWTWRLTASAALASLQQLWTSCAAYCYKDIIIRIIGAQLSGAKWAEAYAEPQGTKFQV